MADATHYYDFSEENTKRQVGRLSQAINGDSHTLGVLGTGLRIAAAINAGLTFGQYLDAVTLENQASLFGVDKETNPAYEYLDRLQFYEYLIEKEQLTDREIFKIISNNGKRIATRKT